MRGSVTRSPGCLHRVFFLGEGIEDYGKEQREPAHGDEGRSDGSQAV
jgi:hypothetical protein